MKIWHIGSKWFSLGGLKTSSRFLYLLYSCYNWRPLLRFPAALFVSFGPRRDPSYTWQSHDGTRNNTTSPITPTFNSRLRFTEDGVDVGATPWRHVGGRRVDVRVPGASAGWLMLLCCCSMKSPAVVGVLCTDHQGHNLGCEQHHLPHIGVFLF